MLLNCISFYVFVFGANKDPNPKIVDNGIYYTPVVDKCVWLCHHFLAEVLIACMCIVVQMDVAHVKIFLLMLPWSWLWLQGVQFWCFFSISKLNLYFWHEVYPWCCVDSTLVYDVGLIIRSTHLMRKIWYFHEQHFGNNNNTITKLGEIWYPSVVVVSVACVHFLFMDNLVLNI